MPLSKSQNWKNKRFEHQEHNLDTIFPRVPHQSSTHDTLPKKTSTHFHVCLDTPLLSIYVTLCLFSAYDDNRKLYYNFTLYQNAVFWLVDDRDIFYQFFVFSAFPPLPRYLPKNISVLYEYTPLESKFLP